MLESIIDDFHRSVCSSISLAEEGVGRFRVKTPFTFDDGDHIVVVLTERNSRYSLTDEGHTFMHISYWLDESALRKGTRQEIITNTLSQFGVTENNGVLSISVSEANYGSALYSFVQAILHISDVTYLSRERVISTFSDDFNEYFTNNIPERHRAFNWYDSQHDPDGKYRVSCRIDGLKPINIFALQNDDQVRDATISLLQFQKWDTNSHSIGIFEEQESINRQVLARFTDECDRMFSTLKGNEDRIHTYLEFLIPSRSQ